MNDLVKIRAWLGNPKADYKEGLALYDKYKPSNKFDHFLQQGLIKPDATSFNVLKHKLHQVAHLITANPAYFEKKLVASAEVSKMVGSRPTPAIKAPGKNQAPLKDGFDPASLPADLAKSYERIQKIVPLLGATHAKLKASQDASVSQKLIAEISSLDKEKRELWADIDAHLGNDPKKRNVKEPVKTAAGDKETELRKQLKNTRDSMNRRVKTMEKQKENKPHLVKKSIEAIDGYNKRIRELEKELRVLEKEAAKA